MVTHEIGSDVTALHNESINVIGSNLGIIMPSREELMMDEGRRDRVGEVETLESREASKDTSRVFARHDVLRIKLERVLDGGPIVTVGTVEETGKGGEA